MKKLIAVCLIAFCFVAVVSAQGLKANLAANNQRLTVYPDGSYVIEQIAAAVAEEKAEEVAPAPAVVEEPAPAPVAAPAPAANAKVEKYELVGYSFIFALDGNKLEVKFVDIVSADEIKTIINAVKGAFPGAEVTNPKAGNITVVAQDAISDAQFDAFVAGAKDAIYDYFY